MQSPGLEHLQRLASSSAHSKIADLLSLGVLSKLEGQFHTDGLKIAEETKELRLQVSKKQDPTINMQQLLSKRSSMQRELEELTKEEQRLKFLHQEEQKAYQVKRQRVELTKDDIAYLRQLKKSHEEFEKGLQEKTRVYEDNLKKIQQQQTVLEEQRRSERIEEKRKKLQKSKEEFQKKRQERLTRQENGNEALRRVQQKQFLHEVLNEKWRGEEEQIQRKQREEFEVKRQKFKMSLEQIKQHERKHDQVAEQRRREREQRSNEMLSQSTMKQVYHSKFFFQAREEEERQKQVEAEKRTKVKENFDRKTEYAEIVRENFKPRIKLPDSLQEEKKKQQIRSLSVADLHKKGNEYMRSANESVTQLPRPAQQGSPKEQKPFKYPNYLSEIRMGSTVNGDSSKRYLDEIKQIMRKENMTQEEKFFKAKMLTQKIEENTDGKSKKLIESINAKIHILKQLSES